MTETWRPADGAEGRYEVSNLGRVRSLDRVVTYSDGRRYRYAGAILNPTADSNGYPTVKIGAVGKPRTRRVHELVATAFLGPRPPGTEVCHEDGNPGNNRSANLHFGTHRENMRDMSRHGTSHAARTHCIHGHRLVAPNLDPKAAQEGRRQCRACSRARKEVRKAAMRGRVLDFDEAAARQYARLTSGDHAA
jgi:hypothetical protein